MKPVGYAVEHTRLYRYTYEYYYWRGRAREGRDLTRDILSSHLDGHSFPLVHLPLFIPFYPAAKRMTVKERDTRARHFSATSRILFISFHVRTSNSFAFPSRLVQLRCMHILIVLTVASNRIYANEFTTWPTLLCTTRRSSLEMLRSEAECLKSRKRVFSFRAQVARNCQFD